MAIKYYQFFNPVYYFVDSNGKPLSGGALFFYKAKDHSYPDGLKKVYKIPPVGDDPGVEWPNPLPLNSAGFQSDNYGIYGSDDEPYYIEVRATTDHTSQLIFSEDNFVPPVGSGGGATTSEVALNKYLYNGQFTYYYQNYDNPDQISVPAHIVDLAPGGWSFQKNNTSATDKIKFDQFVPGQTEVPQNPVNYFHYICSSPGTGETFKNLFKIYYGTPGIPGTGVSTFQNQTITVQFEGLSITSSNVRLSLYQYFGEGGSPYVLTPIKTFALTPNWSSVSQREPFNATFRVPSIEGKAIGPNGDDYFLILLDLPLNTACDIQITNVDVQPLPNMYKYQGENIDSLHSAISGYQIPPISLMPNTADGNYIPMLLQNQKQQSYISLAGVIASLGFAYKTGLPFLYCDASPVYLADYYNLVTKITSSWGKGTNSFTASVSDIVQCVCTSNGVTAAATAETSGYGLLQLSVGSATTPGRFNIFCLSASETTNSSYFKIHTPSTTYYVWFSLNNTGVDPAIPGETGIKIIYTGSETSAQMAALLVADINTGITSTISTNSVQATCFANGAISSIQDVNSGFHVNQQRAGSGGTPAIANIVCLAGSAIVPGSYFLINTPGIGYYVWFSLNNQSPDPGNAPSLAGKKGIKIVYPLGFTATDIAIDLGGALNIAQVLLPDFRGLFERGRDNGAARDPDAASRTALHPGGATGNNVGSYEADEFASHFHTTQSYRLSAGAVSFGPGAGNMGDGSGTNSTGGAETRPKNVYVDKVIFY